MAYVNTPVMITMDQRLTDNDVRLWMTMRLDRRNKSYSNVFEKVRLAKRTDFSRTTIYNSLERLSAAGWYDPAKPDAIINPEYSKGHWVQVPDDLILDKSLSSRDVVASCRLRDLVYPRRLGRAFTYRSLAAYLGVCVTTAKCAVAALAKASWLTVRQKNQLAPVYILPESPNNKYSEEQIRRIDLRVKRAPWLGECIALNMVAQLVDTVYWHGGYPSFLINPKTGELMQIDIWLPEYKVAIEFNGQQHTSATDLATAEDVAKQKERDVLKKQLLESRKIHLIVLTAADLSLQAIASKLRGLVPLRNLKPYPKLVDYLNALGARYQRRALQFQS